ncbi:hypothetical protein [Morganella morganii]|uniref:hypothetical protein n=1 Tax=Morganella morganii TaxID=582 RepID=UPI000F81BA34|nr:hypothetical protein [Morganella morganii]MBT0403662.1 hypothetical protein [Morganella morganii subsp. morganii]RTY34592.1 hypothetical protein EKS33_02805 [Morganella morganii subsp. morganii]HEI8864300.1 hypothetical protein [Morganella morganii]
MTEVYEHASIRAEMASDATIRDYFAAKAMQGLLSNDQCKPFGMSASATDIAKKSYLMADEMLRAREK